VGNDQLESGITGSTRALDYFVLDVFAGRRLEGNPLAVFLHPGSLTAAEMQAIARETNLSETTFIERRDLETERREGVRVRIFTTQEELPFAGHPTLGTASLLSVIAPEVVIENTIRLALNVGSVPVRFTPRDSSGQPWPIEGQMTQRDPEFGETLDPLEVASLTGLAVDDLSAAVPIQIVSTGTAFAIVPLRSASALSRLAVRQAEAGSYLRARGARWFYVLGPEAGDAQAGSVSGPTDTPQALPQWRARMQFNGGEDPATGSAAGCAISLLVHHGAVASDQTIHVRQGVEMHRPSDLYLAATRRTLQNHPASGLATGDVTNVRVGGSTILVAKGQLFLP
jgi:trans-2,3-dihydro-3-hydroxyanthranilate isomerase